MSQEIQKNINDQMKKVKIHQAVHLVATVCTALLFCREILYFGGFPRMTIPSKLDFLASFLHLLVLLFVMILPYLKDSLKLKILKNETSAKACLAVLGVTMLLSYLATAIGHIVIQSIYFPELLSKSFDEDFIRILSLIAFFLCFVISVFQDNEKLRQALPWIVIAWGLSGAIPMIFTETLFSF